MKEDNRGWLVQSALDSIIFSCLVGRKVTKKGEIEVVSVIVCLKKCYLIFPILI